jgi:hypothetical protein
MQQRTPILAFMLAGWMASAAVPAHALAVDPLIEGAKQCTNHLPRFERQYGIPTHLLSAIASTESGRYHSGLKIKLPWPWTINAEGKGYYFDTKEEAIATARKLRASGVRSMDVGCMQVNLLHHPGAFGSLEQAFDPQSNVAYSASFLRSLYQETGSWKDAAGDYHSKTPQLGTKYVGLVYNSWHTIIERLRAARLTVPQDAYATQRELGSPSVARPVVLQGAQQPQQQASVNPRQAKAITVDKNGKARESLTVYQAPRMNQISVSMADGSPAKPAAPSVTSQRERGVNVVRSQPNAKPAIRVVDDVRPVPVSATVNATTANGRTIDVNTKLSDILPSQPMETMVIAQTSNNISAPAPSADAKVIRLDDRLQERRLINQQPVPRSGPNFIFSD